MLSIRMDGHAFISFYLFSWRSVFVYVMRICQSFGVRQDGVAAFFGGLLFVCHIRLDSDVFAVEVELR